MASITEDSSSLDGPDFAKLPPGAAASYLRIAIQYETMAATADREGNPVRAANQREAAATYRALAIELAGPRGRRFAIGVDAAGYSADMAEDRPQIQNDEQVVAARDDAQVPVRETST